MAADLGAVCGSECGGEAADLGEPPGAVWGGSAAAAGPVHTVSDFCVFFNPVLVLHTNFYYLIVLFF